MLRRTPIKRSAPPKRKTPIKRRSTRKRAAARRPGMSAKHLELIRQLPCCVTGRPPRNDPHHIKSGPAKDERGIGLKATDRWAVPLCRAAHNAVEVIGSHNEVEWFRKHGIADVVALAKALWAVTGDLEKMELVVQEHSSRQIIARGGI